MLLFLLNILICSVAIAVGRLSGDEPMCPKFYYEEKTLEKVVRLEHQLELKEKVIQTLEEKLNNQELMLSEHEKRMDAMEVQKQKDIDTVVPTVAFLANGVSKEEICIGNVAVYKNSLLNIGDGYDVNSGFFTAPVSGLYIFNTHVCSTDSQHAHLYIVAKETVIASAVHNGNTQWGTCMSFGGIAVLREGDTAAVKGSHSCYNAFMDTSLRWNSFSGVLINKTT